MPHRKSSAESVSTVYYTDELRDDFAGISRKPFVIDGSYPYRRRCILWKLAEFLVYRVVMTPFAHLYCKIKYHYRVVNKACMKEIGKKGCFVYGNHTLMDGDAFLPSMIAFPKKTKVVVNSDNLAVPLTRHWIELSGAIPVPTEQSGMRHFLGALESSVKQGHSIQIYPEAHIWPYYGGIRPFEPSSFRYPVRFHAPVFCSTVTYQAPRRGKTPRVTVYVDGPFYPSDSLSVRENTQWLRDTVYQTMCERSKNTSYTPIRYVKKASEENETP